MLNPYTKALLGFPPTVSDRVIKREWDKRVKGVCKPCWELKYCPYGPLVEQFPLLSSTRQEAVEHNEFLKEQLKIGAYDSDKQVMFEKEVQEFNPNDYPVRHSKRDMERACLVFGHLCPVFFVNEPLTETSDLRKIGRSIPRPVMLRVVRRDNYQCQICGKPLKDVTGHLKAASRGRVKSGHMR